MHLSVHVRVIMQRDRTGHGNFMRPSSAEVATGHAPEQGHHHGAHLNPQVGGVPVRLTLDRTCANDAALGACGNHIVSEVAAGKGSCRPLLEAPHRVRFLTEPAEDRVCKHNCGCDVNSPLHRRSWCGRSAVHLDFLP